MSKRGTNRIDIILAILVLVLGITFWLQIIFAFVGIHGYISIINFSIYMIATGIMILWSCSDILNSGFIGKIRVFFGLVISWLALILICVIIQQFKELL